MCVCERGGGERLKEKEDKDRQADRQRAFCFRKHFVSFTEINTCPPRQKDGLKRVLEKIMKHIEDMMILTSRKHIIAFRRRFIILFPIINFRKDFCFENYKWRFLCDFFVISLCFLSMSFLFMLLYVLTICLPVLTGLLT